MAEPEVRLRGVTKRFVGQADSGPARAAVDDVSLDVDRGELVVLVGPSGCGKSTTLRLIAGLDEPDAGAVWIGGQPMAGVAPQDRDVAMVFQGYALYPHMTAREIIEFPLKMRRVPRAERARAAGDVAAMLRIEALLDRRPAELSGGERQRVAMARAIVRKPRVFLFDEPLSNLDAALRGEIRLQIGLLVRRLGVTAVYVTHDHVEAMTLADRLVVMRGGRVRQVGTPREVYERPASSFVGEFLGTPRMNLLPARRAGEGMEAGPFRIPNTNGSLPERFQVGVRPEHVRLGGKGAEGAGGVIVAVEPLGAETHVVVQVGDFELRARARGFESWTRGDAVSVEIDADHVVLFAPGDDGPRVLVRTLERSERSD